MDGPREVQAQVMRTAGNRQAGAAALIIAACVFAGCARDTRERFAVAPAPETAPAEGVGMLERPPVEGAAETPPDLAAVLDELALLRKEIRQLRDSFDALLDDINEELGEAPPPPRRGPEPPAPPEPTRPLVPSPAIPETPDAEPSEPPPPAALPGETFDYTLVRQWGRSPDQVRGMSGEVSSLLGMICAVPPGTSDEALSQLGRWFRTQFADYDNINIKVFDSEEAAEVFAQTNVTNSKHHVLSVSKHEASRLDAIMLLREGSVTQVPWTPEAATPRAGGRP